MAAYVIVELTVTDAETMARYRPLAGESVARHGGRFLVRGGAPERIEGEGAPDRVVVIEFADTAAARRWYAAEDYRAILPLRLAASRGTVTLVEGV